MSTPDGASIAEDIARWIEAQDIGSGVPEYVDEYALAAAVRRRFNPAQHEASLAAAWAAGADAQYAVGGRLTHSPQKNPYRA